ncbi:60S ribosomal protein L23a-like [Pteronotus mesoamericanus]|uniref:60S ribosomal protein L23a-like n=1 Tax=Pteronotus mesoamericanus TaxID=1884717 RepID=UPI0023EC4A4F|nr:60S ribosomal protein L23a-like [Pteronotus parnellii mesoamericanus]
MTPKVKKEAPAPPRAEAKAKALRAKKTALKVPPGYRVSREEDRRQLVFVVDVKANKHQIKHAMKELYDIDATKVNTLVRPDGEEKACVQLVPDYDALDVANKIRII